MRKPKLGDIYELDARGKLAYVQYVKLHDDFGYLIRAFTTLYDFKPDQLISVLGGPSFLRFYQIPALLKPPALIRYIGNGTLTAEDQQPLRMRSDSSANGPWQLYEEGEAFRSVAELSAAQQSWPVVYSIIPHPWLVLLILKSNGIHVSVSDLAKDIAQVDDKVPLEDTLFFVYFSTKARAVKASADISLDDQLKFLTSRIAKGDSSWTLRLNGAVAADRIHSIGDRVSAVASKYKGKYDGFETPV